MAKPSRICYATGLKMVCSWSRRPGLPLKEIRVCRASHPVPDERGIAGTLKILGAGRGRPTRSGDLPDLRRRLGSADRSLQGLGLAEQASRRRLLAYGATIIESIPSASTSPAPRQAAGAGGPSGQHVQPRSVGHGRR